MRSINVGILQARQKAWMIIIPQTRSQGGQGIFIYLYIPKKLTPITNGRNFYYIYDNIL
jgi:hypothetical protein